MSDNGAYMKKVLLQVEDLNAVIEKIKFEDFVDKDNICLRAWKQYGRGYRCNLCGYSCRRYKGYNIAVSGYIS